MFFVVLKLGGQNHFQLTVEYNYIELKSHEALINNKCGLYYVNGMHACTVIMKISTSPTWYVQAFN